MLGKCSITEQLPLVGRLILRFSVCVCVCVCVYALVNGAALRGQRHLTSPELNSVLAGSWELNC